MELRPFRSLRYSPRVVAERGLSNLIGPPVGGPSAAQPPKARAPENILGIALPAHGDGERPAAAARTLEAWLGEEILLRERRPGLWIYRQTIPELPGPIVVSLLVGLVRLTSAAARGEPPSAPLDPRSPEERLAMRRALQADFEPCLLLTRAPLSAALATTRRPDLTAEDETGRRHDAYRIHDYAQHVELQGLVKSAEVVLASGRELWETARQFETEPEAEKLPGAKYKLGAILEETYLREHRGAPLPDVALGFFGVSLQDPVY